MSNSRKIEWEELTEKQQKDMLEKSYSIICDRTNNTEEDIENRIINVEVVFYGDVE